MKNFITTDGFENVLDLQLNVLVFQQGDYYVALCPSLNLSSYGDSVEEAKKGFDEVMESYLEDCEENGSLREDLIKHGWQLNDKDQNKAEPPPVVELDIPGGALRIQYNESWKVSA